jgi:hypothetical protein
MAVELIPKFRRDLLGTVSNAKSRSMPLTKFRLELRGAQVSVRSAEIPCPSDTWQHVAVEGDLNKSSISFFVNGVLSVSHHVIEPQQLR